jgi:hypothetical protein
MRIFERLFRRRQPAPTIKPNLNVPPPAADTLGSATLPVVRAGAARGERNRNWGNIDFSRQNPWVGQVGIEPTGNPPRFAVFATPEHGIRAMYRLLNNYQKNHGLRTIKGMVDRWAPSNENNTGAYVSFVASRAGYPADAHVDLSLIHI